MNDPMTNEHLQQLIAEGATLTLTKLGGTPGTVGLAYGQLFRKRGAAWSLFYVEMWADDEFDAHVVEGIDEPAKRQRTGDLLRDGQLLGTVAPMEPNERDEWNWDKWKEMDSLAFEAWCEEQFKSRTT